MVKSVPKFETIGDARPTAVIAEGFCSNGDTVVESGRLIEGRLVLLVVANWFKNAAPMRMHACCASNPAFKNRACVPAWELIVCPGMQWFFHAILAAERPKSSNHLFSFYFATIAVDFVFEILLFGLRLFMIGFVKILIRIYYQW